MILAGNRGMTMSNEIRELNDTELEAVSGGNIIQAVQAVLSWFPERTCGACAESKGQIQGELARFR